MVLSALGLSNRGWLTRSLKIPTAPRNVTYRGNRPQPDDAVIIPKEDSDWDIEDISLAAQKVRKRLIKFTYQQQKAKANIDGSGCPSGAG